MNSIWFFLITFFTLSAHAQSVEMSCRAKAKEIARETYSSCVTEAKQGQINQIREEYQAKLSELKSHYDRELKKVAGKSNKSTAAAPDNTAAGGDIVLKPTKTQNARPGRPERPVKGVARSLPTKSNDNGPALPVQTVGEDAKSAAKADMSNSDDEAPAIVDVPADN